MALDLLLKEKGGGINRNSKISYLLPLRILLMEIKIVNSFQAYLRKKTQLILILPLNLPSKILIWNITRKVILEGH